MLNDIEAHVVLGVAANADAATIKKAFRRLAMRWHPDRNPDPAALEHFKRLRAAHDRMLGATEATDPDEDGNGAESPPPEPPDARPSRGADRFQDVELSLEQAFGGCEIEVPLESVSDCDTCAGSGRVQLAHGRLCQACHGTGRIRTKAGLAPCDDCGGRGYSNQATCADCAGTGKRRAVRMLMVKVPAGMLADEELRLEGKGEPAAHPEGRAGNLRLRIRLSAHPLFRLDGRDLVLERPLSAFRMLAGGKMVVPVLGAVIEVELPAGSCEAREMRIEGAGFSGRGSRPAGALRVALRPVFPTTASPKLLALYRKLDAELSQDAASTLAPVQDWERTWLSRI